MSDIEPLDAEAVVIEPDGQGPPVDPPRAVTFADVVSRYDERRPIIPASLRSRDGRRALLTLAGAAAAHGVAWQLSRSPFYLGKVLWYAPIGLGRAVWRAGKWASAEEGNWHLRQHAASRGDIDGFLALDRQRMKSASGRWWVFGLVAVAVLVAALLMYVMAPAWMQAAAITIAALILARIGRPEERPILEHAFNPARYVRLTADLTRAALVACGAGIKEPKDVRFPDEIRRDGPGYTAIVELPTGIIAGDVIDRRDYLAAGFRLPMAQVWPEPVTGAHPGMLAIWVADRPVDRMKQKPSPLLTCGPLDYWGPLPWGEDVRMRPVSWRCDERNSMFGGMPGSGKTLAARNVGLAAAMDPLVRFAISELKGSGDLDPLEPLCVATRQGDRLYASGADEASKDKTMEILYYLDRECERRGPRIREWAKKGLNNENKLNRAIALADPTLFPLVVILDEIQELITDSERGKEAKALVVSIVKRGRSLGIHVIPATQRIDNASVPRGLSSNISNRLALAVPSHTEVDLILGTGAYKRGARPTTFVPPADGHNPWAGWGYLAGRDQPVRASYIDNPTAEKIVQRALALRGDVPTVDIGEERPDRDVLADVVRVFAHVGRPGLHWQQLAELLAAQRPELYAGITAEAISAQARAAGVPSEVVSVDGRNARGCRLRDVEAAAQRALGGGNANGDADVSEAAE